MEKEYIMRKVTVYLIYNWKTDNIKLRKTRPAQKPYTIVSKHTLTYKIPKIDIELFSEEVEVEKAQVEDAVKKLLPELEEEETLKEKFRRGIDPDV